jgi:ribose transport system ATP-binding protein
VHEEPFLQMRGISKRFPGVVALDNVDFEVSAGEVVALVGENGAGKSTLMSVLSGIYHPNEGEIIWDGRSVEIQSVRAAQRLGIAHIHQELMLAPNLDVAGNIFLGREPVRPATRTLDRAAMESSALDHLHRIGVRNIRPDQRTDSLTTGQRQMVEIAKALSCEARLVVMDEPTSSLTLNEVEKLYEVIRELKRQNIAVVYISHRLDEIFEVSDRVVVLRDGQRVATFATAETNHEEIVRAMVGRELTDWHPRRDYERADVMLDVHQLVVPGAPGPNSFQVYKSEILGFAGLVGAGRTEIMNALFGAELSTSGAMLLNGLPYSPRHPGDAIGQGVFLAPEDRKLHGLVLDMSVQHNITLPSIKDYSSWKIIKRKKEQEVARTEVDRMRIRTPSLNQRTGNLSGGNQQKCAMAKWLARTPTVLILDEPTRGIDVGAKREIYDHIVSMAFQGLSIIMVSSDMEEVLGMSDRVAVMHEGRIMGILDRQELITEENVMTLATGRRLEN